MQAISKTSKRKQAAPARLLHKASRVAVMLDVSKSQVYNLINRGDLECVRIGEAIRIPDCAVRKLVGGRSNS
jgi:excisionase family DNA binding protein